MVPVWIALFFISFISFYMVMDASRYQTVYTEAESRSHASSMMAYTKAVKDYVLVNPTATGHISITALGPYWQTGYTHDGSRWNNFIDTNGKLYIYSLSTVNNDVLAELYALSNYSPLIGSKVSGGNFRSYNGALSWALPTALSSVPTGAVVIVGR